MKTYKNLDDYILNAPHFIIPYDCLSELYIVKLRMDKEYQNYIHEEIVEEIEKKYPNYKKLDLIKIKKIILDAITNEEDYAISKTGQIILNCEDIPEDMMQCDNCGNIWDGLAQCNCSMSPFY